MFNYVLNTPEFSCKQSLGWQGTDISNTHEKSKNQSVTDWYGSVKYGAMDKNVECLCCHEVDAKKYFELLGMRYGDMNAATQRV